MNFFSAELSKVGIDPKILESGQLIGTLSGGEKVKIQIAKLLVKNPDVWLLDEPTNDLDIETLEWLETFMLSQEKPILFVSHDETLLENVANRILHLEYLKNSRRARHTLANTDYSTYVNERNTSLEKQGQAYSREKREYLKDKQILSRQKSAVRTAQIKIKDSAVRRILNKKMKNILVQERYAEEKRKTEKVEVEDPIYMQFDERARIPNGKVVLDLNLDELRLRDKTLSQNIKLFVKGPEKIGIVGKNGVGKTTLLRYIYENLRERDDIKVGYMSQDYNEVLPADEKVLDYLTSGLEDIEEDLMKAYIGRIKLTWDEMNSIISSLSLGQKAKVILLKIMLRGDNVLILDEPTRNMSALSNPVIRRMLKDFKGAIISVSHDRKYLEEVCDNRYNLTPEGLERYELRKEQ
jgi:ATPase subunit of ABC transporter with duplicated ATPase domains